MNRSLFSIAYNGMINETGESKEFKCPYGQVGDTLWVRETWRINGHLSKHYMFKADFPLLGGGMKWNPAIHMPREACRLVLQITDIRVERLNDICVQDAIAEGMVIRQSDGTLCSRLTAFELSWRKIYGDESWDKDPFVWVITFKIINH